MKAPKAQPPGNAQVNGLQLLSLHITYGRKIDSGELPLNGTPKGTRGFAALISQVSGQRGTITFSGMNLVEYPNESKNLSI